MDVDAILNNLQHAQDAISSAIAQIKGGYPTPVVPPIITPPPVITPPAGAPWGLTATKIIEGWIPAEGQSNVRWFTSNRAGPGIVGPHAAQSGFYRDDLVVFTFISPGADGYFNIGVNETGTGASGGPYIRTFALSTVLGDFESAAVVLRIEDTGLNINASVGGGQRVNLQPGMRYYLNIANRDAGQPSVPERGDVFITAANP